jgi:hypothetical protein
MKNGAIILTGFFLLAGASVSAADSFRVRAMTPVTIDSQKPEAQSIELGYNDAIGISFPQDVSFIKAVEIEIKIPRSVIENPSCMAWGLYRQIKPAPTAKKIDYQGEELSLQPLPSRLSFVLQIPLEKEHGLKSGPYATVLPYVHDTTKGPILFRLLPIMKGLPDNIETVSFSVRVKPILDDDGGARISIDYPTDQIKPVSVRIDEMPIDNPGDLQILAPGTHHLSIVSDDYRNEVRVFTIEAARVTVVSVKMKDTTPKLFITAPESAEVSLDGVQFDGMNAKEGRVLEPGEHLIRFRIGDYEVTRPITVEKGKDYTVSMILDVTVTETP